MSLTSNSNHEDGDDSTPGTVLPGSLRMKTPGDSTKGAKPIRTFSEPKDRSDSAIYGKFGGSSSSQAVKVSSKSPRPELTKKNTDEPSSDSNIVGTVVPTGSKSKPPKSGSNSSLEIPLAQLDGRLSVKNSTEVNSRPQESSAKPSLSSHLSNRSKPGDFVPDWGSNFSSLNSGDKAQNRPAPSNKMANEEFDPDSDDSFQGWDESLDQDVLPKPAPTARPKPTKKSSDLIDSPPTNVKPFGPTSKSTIGKIKQEAQNPIIFFPETKPGIAASYSKPKPRPHGEQAEITNWPPTRTPSVVLKPTFYLQCLNMKKEWVKIAELSADEKFGFGRPDVSKVNDCLQIEMTEKTSHSLNINHVQIRPYQDRVLIEPLPSRNGVYKKISSEEPLTHGSQFSLGRLLIFKFELPTPKPPKPQSAGAADTDEHALVQEIQPNFLLSSARADGSWLPIPVFKDDYFLIGRASKDQKERVDLPISGIPTLSRKHAMIFRKHESYYLRNMSINSFTLIKIDKPAEINFGDEFLCGEFMMRVVPSHRSLE